jgi:hypothetical protein
MHYAPPANSNEGAVQQGTYNPAEELTIDGSFVDIPYDDSVDPGPKDYYEPHANSNVGALERRMLYLVHQLTFTQYFVARPYATILREHRTRIDRAPSAIDFPLGANVTKARFAILIDALHDAGWQNKTLQELCEMEIDMTGPVWRATGQVDEAGIFIPYYHAGQKSDVQALFNNGFVDDEAGWGRYKVHALFSTRALDYAVPGHAIRRATLRKAKHVRVIRPRITRTLAEENFATMGKGNSRYCSGPGCTWCGDPDCYCSTTATNECSLMSDTH